MDMKLYQAIKNNGIHEYERCGILPLITTAPDEEQFEQYSWFPFEKW
jgi:hypothetical protein